MTDPTCFCHAAGDYCPRCDLLVGLPALHVIGVTRDEVGLRVEVESAVPPVMGCPACGVVAHAHGRQQVELIDAPCFAAPVRLCQWILWMMGEVWDSSSAGLTSGLYVHKKTRRR